MKNSVVRPYSLSLVSEKGKSNIIPTRETVTGKHLKDIIKLAGNSVY